MSPEITITDADAKSVKAKSFTTPTLQYCPVCGGKLTPGGKSFTNKNGSVATAAEYCVKCNYMGKVTISQPTS